LQGRGGAAEVGRNMARGSDPLFQRINDLRAAADHWQRVAQCRAFEIKKLRERVRVLEAAQRAPEQTEGRS